MERKASEIQKQRIKEIESAADRLVGKCKIMFVSSVNENGYPRTCCVSKLKDAGFRDLVFVTSKRSEKQGKAKHFEAFFPKGIDDPKIRFVHFHTLEATFWINHKFRTVKYK